MKTNLIILSAFLTAITLLISSAAMAEPENEKPQSGDTCDRSSFKEFCNGDFIMQCLKGKVRARDCAARNKIDTSYTCAVFITLAKADCVLETDQCSTENEKVTRETEYTYGKKKTDFLRCEKTIDGKLYYRRFASDINANKQDPVKPIQKTDNEIKEGQPCDSEGAVTESKITSKSGRKKLKKFKCTKNKRGELVYKIHQVKNDNRPKDALLDLPF